MPDDCEPIRRSGCLRMSQRPAPTSADYRIDDCGLDPSCTVGRFGKIASRTSQSTPHWTQHKPLPACPAARTRRPQAARAILTLGFLRHRLRDSGNPLVFRPGGITYHHIADTYIALFTHFIACGVWEAVYIIEGLLKNESELQPTTIHADTQGQSFPVFSLAHLLGLS
jgi:hypothetical protein